jgi:allophanate hydrolase subunit 1
MGEYTASFEYKNGVMLLHNADKTMYDDLALALAKKWNEFYEFRFQRLRRVLRINLYYKIKAKASNRKHMQELIKKLGIGSHRVIDDESTYQYLVSQLGDHAKVYQ